MKSKQFFKVERGVQAAPGQPLFVTVRSMSRDGQAQVQCVLCGELYRDNYYSRGGHARMHVKRGQAVRSRADATIFHIVEAPCTNPS